jgi:DNA primase
MAGKIPASFIQDLLARVDLVDLIDARVPLKRSGTSFVARCPFHNEKSPSFNVSREKQFYHCFGCGAHGNAIGFLMEYDRMTFPEAVEHLADSMGMTVPREESGKPEERRQDQSIEQIYELQERVCRFYQRQLKEHAVAARAVEYLKARGISGEIARRFRLGYAPPGNRSLPDGFSTDLLRAAGLLSIKENGSTYDWFRDRIVLPIRDRRGRIVGFGGRVIGDGVPKYLNSPETPVFKKHKEVYGLYELLREVRKPDFIIVVEGYMDVIALAQFDIPNTVATLGTATSVDHINLLFRYTNELVLCFDGDTAGRNAAWKALEAALPALREGRQLRFMPLPDKHDPDSLVRAEGAEQFIARLKGAAPFSDYFFGHFTDRLDLRTIEGRASLVQSAKPFIAKLPAGVFRDMIEQRLEELTGHAQSARGDESTRLAEARGSGRRHAGTMPSALRTFLALLLQNPRLAEYISDTALNKLAELDRGGKLIEKVMGYLRENPDAPSGAIEECFRESPDGNLVRKLTVWPTQIAADKLSEEFQAHLRFLTQDRYRERRLEELIRRSQAGILSAEEREELRVLTTQ